ncbi:hypothetical protein [Nocardia paucivorans]|uniref:hypothetical protein n=1 Tax=Nocardia paucivorans TaxID=114259 RepID=UPI000592BBBC|nr:hypothetical protein [Nocardia paucivorans]
MRYTSGVQGPRSRIAHVDSHEVDQGDRHRLPESFERDVIDRSQPSFGDTSLGIVPSFRFEYRPGDIVGGLRGIGLLQDRAEYLLPQRIRDVITALGAAERAASTDRWG